MKKEKQPLETNQSAQKSSASDTPENKTLNDSTKNERSNNIDRRSFLGRAAVAGIFSAAVFGAPNLLGRNFSALAQTSSNCPNGCELGPLMGIARADAARTRRVNAANFQRNMDIPSHPCNGDEVRYAADRYIASFTKGLQRASGVDGSTFGEVSPAVYCSLLRAIESGNPADFEAVTLGFSNDCTTVMFSDEASRLGTFNTTSLRQRRLESPQAGYNFDLEGTDYHQLVNRPAGASDPPVAFPPAYTFASEREAVEIIENYWQALTRDVPFIEYGSNTIVAAASTDLSQFVQYYDGPIDPVSSSSNPITPSVYSRGILPGDISGPFISQLFLRNVPYGAQTIPATIRSPQTVIQNEFMTTADEWRIIQRGRTPSRETAYDSTPRYIRNGRDLAEYVRNDAIYQAYLNAALILMTPRNRGGLEVPLNPNNPYRPDRPGGYCKQLNFVEFGPSQLLSLLGEVSVRAHKAIWYQKWQVHRRLRPEEFGGRVHFKLTNQRNYPINNIINQSNVFSRIATRYGGNYFLPQAFPEGSPLHPAYGSGHATLAGACVTILKAWFDSELSYGDFATFVVPAANGLSLVPFTTSDVFINTVGGELNKLASNISVGRNIAGVHWRSDYTESVLLGEQVAINLLRDYGFTYNEAFLGFQFRDFSGNLITVGEKRTV